MIISLLLIEKFHFPLQLRLNVTLGSLPESKISISKESAILAVLNLAASIDNYVTGSETFITLSVTANTQVNVSIIEVPGTLNLSASILSLQTELGVSVGYHE